MKQTRQSYVGVASIALMLGSVFAACGAPDARKVVRGPRYTPTEAGETSQGGSPGAGGSDAKGGDSTGNPFGGNPFGGAPPVLDGPPQVVQVKPADMAMDVEVDADVSLLFSEAIDPATATTDSVQLLDQGTPLSGDVSLQQDIVATFDPARRLSLASTYDVAVTTAVTDTAGNALQEAFTSSFATRDGVWEADVPILDAAQTVWQSYTSTVLAGIDGRGNTLVVWSQITTEPNQYDFEIWGRWHRPTGWQPATKLSDSSGVNGTFRVAVSPEGDAAVVWSQYDSVSSLYQIAARRYTGGAWDAMPVVASGQVFQPLQNVSHGPYVLLRNGRVVTWWISGYYNGTYSYDTLYGQSATIDGAFKQYADQIDYYYTGSDNFGGEPAAAMDPQGNVIMVYNRILKSGVGTLQYTKYVASNDTWEPPAAISQATNLNYNDSVQVAVDDTGAAMVAWRSPTDVLASRYTKAKGFAPAGPLDLLDTQPYFYDSSLVSNGTDFLMSWSQPVGSTNNAYAARYSTTGAAWSSAELVSDGDLSLWNPPTSMLDPHGNAMVLWFQRPPSAGNYYDTHEYKFARQLAASDKWSKPASISKGKDYVGIGNAVVAQNGIVALVSAIYGYYDQDNSVAGQPYLSVFQ